MQRKNANSSDLLEGLHVKTPPGGGARRGSHGTAFLFVSATNKQNQQNRFWHACCPKCLVTHALQAIQKVKPHQLEEAAQPIYKGMEIRRRLWLHYVGIAHFLFWLQDMFLAKGRHRVFSAAGGMHEASLIPTPSRKNSVSEAKQEISVSCKLPVQALVGERPVKRPVSLCIFFAFWCIFVVSHLRKKNEK